MIGARVLHDGQAQGRVLRLDHPLSFWGAFDPATGTIIDVHHPQCGLCLTDAVLLMRESRGSGSAPGAIAEAIRRGTAPSAIILIEADVNLAIGAAVAQELYGRECPVLQVDAAGFDRLAHALRIAIARGGIITAG